MNAERIAELKRWLGFSGLSSKQQILTYIEELEVECEQLRLDRIVLARLSAGHYNELGATAATALRDQVLEESEGASDGR